MPSNAQPTDPPYPPLSPGTAATLLCIADDVDISETTRAISWGLVHTIRQCTAAAEELLAAARTRINVLEGTVQRRERDIRRLRLERRNPEMPPEYEQNQGRLNVQIADSEG